MECFGRLWRYPIVSPLVGVTVPPRDHADFIFGLKYPPQCLEYLSLVNMVPGQLVEYIILPQFSHPHSTWVLKDDKSYGEVH